MDLQTAAKIEAIMRGICGQLDQSVRLVMDASDPNEFQEYRRKIGRVMGEIFLEVRQPIYDEYPELIPAELKSPTAQSN